MDRDKSCSFCREYCKGKLTVKFIQIAGMIAKQKAFTKTIKAKSLIKHKVINFAGMTAKQKLLNKNDYIASYKAKTFKQQ